MPTAVSDLSRAFALQLAERRLQLPPMPATAAEVLSLCQQESTDAARLSAVIHRDQTIASNVLRVANSAAHGGQTPCASLQQAISRLGLQVIVEIAVAIAVRGRLFASADCAALLAALWRHSVLAGFYAKEIARLRRRNVDIAFLGGLLHDVGKAVLIDHAEQVLGQPGSTVARAELLAALHDQHTAAGCALAEQWRLPEQIVEAIRCHHDVAAATRFGELAMVVHLADKLGHLAKPSMLATALTETELRSDPVLIGLNLYPDQLDALLAMRARAIEIAEGLR